MADFFGNRYAQLGLGTLWVFMGGWGVGGYLATTLPPLALWVGGVLTGCGVAFIWFGAHIGPASKPAGEGIAGQSGAPAAPEDTTKQ